VGIGIGIDTGGTYTDAVAYDFDAHLVRATAKAQTTKADLSVGIGAALDELPPDLLRSAEMISLSTTLATNACVEDKGGRARLLFIGAQPWIVERYGAEYGLPSDGEIFHLDAKTTTTGKIVQVPGWDAFLQSGESWIRNACGVGIVDVDAMYNGGALEKQARELVASTWDMPVVCGHELFSDLNSLRRGASVLLNARLVPLINEFLLATRTALHQRSITAPLVIMRSDGSLMAERFARGRPVETLVCGPSASVIGGLVISGEKDCLVIDMGGTTTDIAIVTGGVPRKANNGVDVGRWKTFVKGLSVRSFGLGGDSALRFDGNGFMRLEPARLLPLSVAASTWPSITTKLAGIVQRNPAGHPLPLHEFFCPLKDISGSSAYTGVEKNFCRALQDGPLSLAEAAEAAGTDAYNLNLGRLEEEGVVLRSGLTPTDIMHLRGDFNQFDTEAAALGASFFASCIAATPVTLQEMVYDAVERALYKAVVVVLLEDQHASLARSLASFLDGLDELIAISWDMARRGRGRSLLGFRLSTPAALVGIGAPIHLFLPAVADALGTRCVIPEYAGVANAIGAIVGSIRVTRRVEIKPEYSIDGLRGYVVFGESGAIRTADQQVAIEEARKAAQEAAREEAVRRGAQGEIALSTEVLISAPKSRFGKEVLVGIRVEATAISKAAY
jgi:N-methylhydantoinase A/oxoprolinase/acetone carboxylase beta subunit